MDIANIPHQGITRSGHPQFRPAHLTSRLFGWRENYTGHGRVTPAIGGGTTRIIPAAFWADGGTRPPQTHAFAKWCAATLVLLMPGSFVVLALLWLARRYVPTRTRT